MSCQGTKGRKKWGKDKPCGSQIEGPLPSLPIHPWFSSVHGLPGACPFLELASSKASSVLRSSAYENVSGAQAQSVRAFALQACRPEFDLPGPLISTLH